MRPYKQAWPIEKALQMIQENSGSHFNPKVVAAFHNILPEILQIKTTGTNGKIIRHKQFLKRCLVGTYYPVVCV